jgi:[acyl-carrier-protein] S-malonyltransferase
VGDARDDRLLDVLALLAPGQGAQSPGFLTPWLALPGLAHRLDWYSAVVGRDLSWLGTAGSESEIRDTAVCQPLLVAIGLAVAAELDVTQAGFVAGHSVGELTAAGIAGALSPEAALVLARERGEAMAEAAAVGETGMSAVLGGDPAVVLEAIEAAGLVAANHNGAGQVVAAGSLTALGALPTALDGVARVMPLKVAGAFHTGYMDPGRKRLETLSAAIPVSDPLLPLVSNADGQVVSSGSDLLARLVAQVSRPVRWDLCQQTFADAGVTALVELPPAGTLAGLARRTLPGVPVVALRSPDDLDAARSLLAQHAVAAAPVPTWRVVVSPAAGTFAPAAVAGSLAPGAVVGQVEGRRETVDAVAVHGGTLVEWLASAGDPVKPGQPLARLHPTGEYA